MIYLVIFGIYIWSRYGGGRGGGGGGKNAKTMITQ